MSTLAPTATTGSLGAESDLDHPTERGGFGPDALFALTLASLLCALGFGAGGGLQISSTTKAEMVLQIAGGLLGSIAILTSAGRRLHGAGALGAFTLFAALTAFSIIWAVQPDNAWQESSRTLAYLAVFGSGIALVRIAPRRWKGLLGAVLLASFVMSAYALLTKVFPASLAADETYSRLREPFGYWNAVGLMAALGIPGCLWLGARRTGHAALNVLAYPILGMLLVAILLAYSRGSLLAAIIACGFWFIVVPLRLRAAVLLATSAAGALLVCAWVFAQDPLSKDNVVIDDRVTSGHELGLLLVAMCAGLLVAGLMIGFATSRKAPSMALRRQAGIAIIIALALVPLGAAIGLSFSQRGLGGSISKGWNELTDPNATTPTNDPGRLTAVGSVRARYYSEAIQIFRARPLYGAGAGGYTTARTRYRKDALEVRHAHGYLFQTAADLGSAGLVVTLLLLVAWAIAAMRPTGLRRRTEQIAGTGAERIGMLTLAAIVITFGVHSLVDWTWFVPGNCVPALLCAGWLAGRGNLVGGVETGAAVRGALRARMQAGLGSRELVGAAVLLIAASFTFAWASWQPLRSVNSGNDALTLAGAQRFDAARAKALASVRQDPLSIEPLFTLAAVESMAGRKDAGRAALEKAVTLQPQNSASWLNLADYELNTLNAPQDALQALGPALYLDPHGSTGVTLFLQASRQVTPAAAATGQPAPQTATP